MPPNNRLPQQLLAGGDGRERHLRQLQEGAAAAAATWKAATSRPPLASKLNAEYNSSLKNAYERTLAHPKFVGITSKLGPEGSGFDEKLYENDIGEPASIDLTATPSWSRCSSMEAPPCRAKRVLKWKDQY